MLLDRAHGSAEQVFQAPSASLSYAPDCDVHRSIFALPWGAPIRNPHRQRT
jgi:hypothetical protein